MKKNIFTGIIIGIFCLATIPGQAQFGFVGKLVGDAFETAKKIGGLVIKGGTEILEGGVDAFGNALGTLVKLPDRYFNGFGGTVGLFYVAGKLYVTGPTGLIPILIQGKAVTEFTNLSLEALVVQRKLTPVEYAYFQKVFNNQLPPREMITLTKLSGAGGRPFVMPAAVVGGGYLVNIGNAYDNPTTHIGSAYPEPGQMLVHELTHVLQLYRAGLTAAQAGKAMFIQVNDILNGDDQSAYDYSGCPINQNYRYCLSRFTWGKSWDSFNPEQQASIMDDYYAYGENSKVGYEYPGQYRYVIENIRKERYSKSGHGAVVSRVTGAYEYWWKDPLSLKEKRNGYYWYEQEGKWQSYVLPGSSEFSNSRNIVSVPKTPLRMDVFWIGADGSVFGNYVQVYKPWAAHGILAVAGSAALNGGIAAVARTPELLEVWWIAVDGSVKGAYYIAGTWKTYQLAPPGSASTEGDITAISRRPDAMEVWWIGNDGSVQGAYYYEGAAWQRYPLAPAGSTPRNGNLASLSRVEQHLEVFWAGTDGSLQDAYWTEGKSWQRFTLAIAGSVALGSDIAAVSRLSNAMEIFWTRTDGSIIGAFTYDGKPWQQYPLSKPGSSAPSDAISAGSTGSNSMVVFWSGTTGDLHRAFWNNVNWKVEKIRSSPYRQQIQFKKDRSVSVQ